MTEPKYIEDIFIELYDNILIKRIPIDLGDKQPMTSFYNILIQGQRITLGQSKFILKLLKKYKNTYYIDDDDLLNPQWKKDFRTIDTSRKTFVEQDSNGHYWICLKFPYQLKNVVEKDILGNGYQYYGENRWDKDRRLRQLKLVDYNIVTVYEFVKTHGFEIDESFFSALSVVEEMWQAQDNIIPYSKIEHNGIKLVNASTETEKFFEKHCTGSIEQDAFTAKTMGFPLHKTPESLVEQLVCKKETHFWIKNFKQFFDITEKINGRIVIVLDRNCDYFEWCKNFSAGVDSYGIDRNDIVICFRTSNQDRKEFNDWVKDNNFSGKVNDQKYLIFLQKPSKWLFKDTKNVKIVATNYLFSNSAGATRTLLESHPCVVYLSDIKPSLRDQNIVEL